MKDAQKDPAVLGPVERPVRPVFVAHGDDEHLTLMGAPWHWNLLHGVDRADMLAFGRACMAAERERCAQICRDHAADKSPPFKEYEDNYLNGWLDAANECGWAIEGPNA